MSRNGLDRGNPFPNNARDPAQVFPRVYLRGREKCADYDSVWPTA